MRRFTTIAALALLLWSAAAGCAGTHRPRATFQGPERDGPTLTAQDPRSVRFVGLTRISSGAVGDDLFPAPLPHGGGVIFSSDRHSDALKLYLEEDGKAGALRLTRGEGNDIQATVAPKGGEIVFASDRDGQWRLYRLSDQSGSSDPQAITDPELTALHPSFDPSGERICYMRRSPQGRWEVWIHTLADGTERFICEGLFPEFHPKKDRLIVQRARDRDARWYSLHLIDLTLGRERELVAGADWGAVNPSFHPDGTWIVFNSVREKSSDDAHPEHGDDLWCMTEDGRRLTRLTETARAEWNPVWGRDGQIYFTATDRERAGIWRMTPRLPESPQNQGAPAMLGMGTP